MRWSPLLTLWVRLTCFACVPAILAVTLVILTGIDGWLMYESSRELAVDIAARITIALLVGILAGAASTLLALPYVLWRAADMQKRTETVALWGVKLMFLVSSCAIVGLLLRWTMAVGLLNLSNRVYIVTWFSLSCILAVVTVTWSIFAGRRFVPQSNLTETVSGRLTRRLLLLAGVGSLLTAFSNELVPQGVARFVARTKAKPSSPNVVMVTFDALSAEDMSCYGYPLVTTPNIDAFAQTATRFSNYYSASTFTTPSIVSMMTGRYPSNTKVYHYGGSLQGADSSKNLAHLLRAAGYTTAASVANPGAHPDCLGFGNDFDRLPPPPIKSAAMREITESFHSAALTNDVGFATRLAPYLLEQISPTRFGQTHSIFPPKLSFGQAKELLKGLEEPYFLWVHTYAPHFPYLPEPPFLKKFLPSNELRTHSDFANLFDLKGYSYTTAKQPLIDKARLRYDEWIAEADFAFGDFMATLHASPSWGKTAMLVSSDHGESFTSGYLGHGGPTQLRPIVHVPLLIHEPGQSTRATISTVADQTRLAPTILDLTQLNRPSWMDGQSLMQLIRGDNIPASSLAFIEYFEGNSAFKPIRHGSVGVLDGQYQYVFDLDQGRGALYDLNASSPQSDDLSGKFPQMAALLHAEIAKRFPYLPEA